MLTMKAAEHDKVPRLQSWNPHTISCLLTQYVIPGGSAQGVLQLPHLLAQAFHLASSTRTAQHNRSMSRTAYFYPKKCCSCCGTPIKIVCSYMHARGQ